MARSAIVLLAPLGAILVGVCSSLSTSHVLTELGFCFEDDHVASLPNTHLIGMLGMVLIGVGVVGVTFARRWASRASRLLYGLAAISFGTASLAIAYGNWIVFAAFGRLATSEALDPEPFLQEVAQGTIPSIVGWGCVILATGLVVVASATTTADPKTRSTAPMRFVPLSFAVLACLALTVAAVWNSSSYLSLQVALTRDPFDVLEIAGGISGMVYSVFVSVIGIAACGMAAIGMAVSPMAKPDSVASAEVIGVTEASMAEAQ